MARLVLNRDGGKTDEFGHLLGLSRFLMGEVIEGLVVSAQASPNMTVQVSSGSAKIPYGTGGTRYDYWVASDAVESVTIATADPANPRIDYIIATVIRTVVPNTTVTNNSNNMLRFISVAGTPAAAPTAPNAAAMQAAAGTGNPYIILRRINVGAGITQITSAQIGLDLRTMAYASRAAIADGQITTDMLAPLAVTNAKIANAAVKSQNIDFTTLTSGVWTVRDFGKFKEYTYVDPIPNTAIGSQATGATRYVIMPEGVTHADIQAGVATISCSMTSNGAGWDRMHGTFSVDNSGGNNRIGASVWNSLPATYTLGNGRYNYRIVK